MHELKIEALTEKNFTDYEKLTSCESGGGCYCSFWHQKISSMSEWDQRKKQNPMLNRQIVLDKVLTGYHVGVLAYQNDKLLAWISIGPLVDFYWSWKRVLKLGEDAAMIAGIMCFTLSPEFRGKGLQVEILEALKIYAKDKGWHSIEAYPFDQSALEKHQSAVLWPGLTRGYEAAGFKKLGPHWLNNPEAERSLYQFVL